MKTFRIFFLSKSKKRRIATVGLKYYLNSSMRSVGANSNGSKTVSRGGIKAGTES